ncbi:hypothetical protein AZE42_10628 [Rhizopogon vesiculosus]|uniref:Uncharacterized protein n=1 Tax=Rhizopogon vesiculosus TaxID=180088 RepID=A0A1J8Q325_9AGAM|nr:hypothetical protein AZE42_10628 [Rhizopogon vesiculosus]
MPATRPRQRRSARLAVRRAPPLEIMEYEGPITRGRVAKHRGSKPRRGVTASNADLDCSKFQIRWHADSSRIERLVQHLLAHPADCCVLYYSNATRSHPDGGIPSGKDKQEVCSVIAQAVFKDDQEYAALLAEFPFRFCDSTITQAADLKKRYHEHYRELHATGAGIVPLDVGAAVNKHQEICLAFPWYDDLHSILGSNPALAVTTISSHPGTNHAESFLKLINPSASSRRTCTHPPPSNAQSTHPSNESITPDIQSTPSSTQHVPQSPSSQHGSTDLLANTQPHTPGPWYDHPSLPGAAQPLPHQQLNYLPASTSQSPQCSHQQLNYPPAGTSQSPQCPHQQLNYLPAGTSQSPQRPHQQSHVFGAAQPPLQSTYPLGGAYSHPQAMTSNFVPPHFPNQPYADNNYDPTPFTADNEVQDYGYMMDEMPVDESRTWDVSFNSPPKIVGNTRQQPNLPSASPPQAHSLSRPTFTLPQTSCTPVHDSCASFSLRTPPDHVTRRTSLGTT